VLFLAMLATSLSSAFGCGETSAAPDSSPLTDMGAVDSGMPNPCWESTLSLPCCYARSNEDRLASPQLRVVDFDNTLPLALTNAAAAYGFTQALRLDALMVGFEIQGTGTDGPVTLRIGTLARGSDGSYYTWHAGDAPGPDDPARWDPFTTMGRIEGELLTSEPAPVPFVVPIHDTDGSTPVELVLAELTFVGVELSHDRTCVGEYDTLSSRVLGEGRITSYVLLDSTIEGSFPVVGVSGCEIFASADCTTPPDTWMYPPDSICDADGCRMGDCTPETCNAWRFDARIGAAGVEIR
jgi:hypothetical protein